MTLHHKDIGFGISLGAEHGVKNHIALALCRFNHQIQAAPRHRGQVHLALESVRTVFCSLCLLGPHGRQGQFPPLEVYHCARHSLGWLWRII
jgi:hypothetical protein